MYYFASDMHLGHGDAQSARHREELLVRWLDRVAEDATAIYLLGDVFDFWYEWGEVVPAGHVRLLGKLAELSDRGIEIHLFTGITICGNEVTWSANVECESTTRPSKLCWRVVASGSVTATTSTSNVSRCCD